MDPALLRYVDEEGNVRYGTVIKLGYCYDNDFIQRLDTLADWTRAAQAARHTWENVTN